MRLGVDGSEAVPGLLENVSISGALVRTAWSGPLGMRIELEILQTDSLGRTLGRVTAHVTRKTPNGTGLEWSDLAPDPVRLLLDPTFLRTVRSSTPATIRRVRSNVESAPPLGSDLSDAEESLRATG